MNFYFFFYWFWMIFYSWISYSISYHVYGNPEPWVLTDTITTAWLHCSKDLHNQHLQKKLHPQCYNAIRARVYWKKFDDKIVWICIIYHVHVQYMYLWLDILAPEFIPRNLLFLFFFNIRFCKHWSFVQSFIEDH